jgi:hypothetical protein
MDVHIPDTVLLALREIADPAENPNAMPDDRFALLVNEIREAGFLQPVLVRSLSGGGYEVVDGVHRLRAARSLGMEHVPCVRVDLSDARASLVQIGMNKLRGELDLSAVARTVADLANLGTGRDELTLTGFTTEELDDMIRLASGADLDPLAGMQGDAPPADEPPPVEKPFTMELRFETAAELKRAKAGLRKAGGKGSDLGAGLLRLLDGALPERKVLCARRIGLWWRGVTLPRRTSPRP